MPIEIEGLHLPRYREIPDVGLYLDQTVKFVNRYLAPLGCTDITASMVSNYVKKGYIANPVRKQYDADQISCLLFIAIVKGVLSMENISLLLRIQEQTYSRQIAYDYFCTELEYRLSSIFNLSESIQPQPLTDTEERKMLESVVTAVVQIIYLSKQFEVWAREQSSRLASDAKRVSTSDQ